MPVINITNSNTRWRVFEKEKLQDTFGDVLDLSVGDLESTKKLIATVPPNDTVIFWRPNSDEITKEEYDALLAQRGLLEGFPMINDPLNYLKTHCKEHAFEVWERSDIKIPKYEVILDLDFDYRSSKFNYPYLVRLNNEVTGRASYLVRDYNELRKALHSLQSQFHNAKTKKKKSFTKKIAVEFIDATKEAGRYNMSYRVIVAGDKVITGYARLSEATDWVAITGKFKYEMGDLFIKYQERCQKMIEENHDTIVKAVSSLGLNLQGVDIIEDQSGQIYFLECQPGFSTGYADWPRPFYNPHYPELVRYIEENKSQFEQRCPLYYNKWLNKETLFTEIFNSLREQIL